MNHQLSFPFHLPPSFEESDYVMSDSNREAFTFIQKWPHWPCFCTLILGSQGSGKSHLGGIYREKSGATLIKTIEIFQDSPPSHTLIDDFSLWSPLSSQQEEALFHLYNSLKSSGKTLLILIDTPPMEWKIKLEDLKSRLRAAPILKLNPPDDELLATVYTKLFSDYQLSICPQIINTLLKTTERSLKTAHLIVQKLSSLSMSQKKNITLPFVRQVIEDQNLQIKK